MTSYSVNVSEGEIHYDNPTPIVEIKKYWSTGHSIAI